MTPTEFITGFILPHENAYAPGHYGDPAFVVAETVPGDSGGTTKYGIDQASHPDVDIPILSQDEAVAIYLEEYTAVTWATAAAAYPPPALPDFPYPAALVFFDCREVCGLTAAWKCLQRALALTDDGIPGPVTKSAVIAAPGLTLAMSQIDERIAYHRQIAAANPQDRQFLDGWENRCQDLKAFQFFTT
jgi:lysozyme family protein